MAAGGRLLGVGFIHTCKAVASMMVSQEVMDITLTTGREVLVAVEAPTSTVAVAAVATVVVVVGIGTGTVLSGVEVEALVDHSLTGSELCHTT